MILVKPSFQILDIPINPLQFIEGCGRTCYKSEVSKDPDKTVEFVQRLIKNGHHSVLEHEKMTVKFIVDRGVTHELVRHRLASYSQESTRYCSYGNNVTFIIPPWTDNLIKEGEYTENDIEIMEESLSKAGEFSTTMMWLLAMHAAETAYHTLLEAKWSPQQARSVLPNSLKTEIIMTANLREWRHVFKLRAAGEAGAPHPQMREIMIPLLNEARCHIPVIFDDIKITD